MAGVAPMAPRHDGPARQDCPFRRWPSSSQGAGALDEPATVGPFYTDSSLKTLKPMAELKEAFRSMPKEKREEVVKLCNDPSKSPRLHEFCSVVNALHKTMIRSFHRCRDRQRAARLQTLTFLAPAA